MTDREPDDLDQLGAKLRAARERSGTDGTKDLAGEGSSFGYGLRLSVELLAGLLVGLGDVSMRLVPAFFGLATLGLVLLTGRWIGRPGALAAAALLAVSPGMVFFSRYAIHEMLLVFFTLAFVLAAARWWEAGRTRFLVAAAAALAALYLLPVRLGPRVMDRAAAAGSPRLGTTLAALAYAV